MSNRYRYLNKALKEHEKYHQIQDNFLYGLCNKYPYHSRIDEVILKVLVIGRGFATGIERQIAVEEHNRGQAIIKLAEHFTRNRELNAIFKRLCKIKGQLTTNKLARIIDEHGYLLEVINEITRKDKKGTQRIARSFASKYMHFHNGWVPLYDSRANSTLTSLVRWSKTLELDESCGDHCDWQYYRFCCRLFELRELIRRDVGRILTPRELDTYLLWIIENPNCWPR